MAAHQTTNPLETSMCTIVEFQRSSAPKVGRVIKFNHDAEHLPYQLKGRVRQECWEAFMRDVDVLAQNHPYVARPGAKDVAQWGLCALLGSVIGVCCMNPDAGSYQDWCESASMVIQRYQGEFNAGGCAVSLHKGLNYYLRIDIDPNAGMVDFGAQDMVPLRSNTMSGGSSYLSPFQSLPSGLVALMSGMSSKSSKGGEDKEKEKNKEKGGGGENKG